MSEELSFHRASLRFIRCMILTWIPDEQTSDRCGKCESTSWIYDLYIRIRHTTVWSLIWHAEIWLNTASNIYIYIFYIYMTRLSSAMEVDEPRLEWRGENLQRSDLPIRVKTLDTYERTRRIDGAELMKNSGKVENGSSGSTQPLGSQTQLFVMVSSRLRLGVWKGKSSEWFGVVISRSRVGSLAPADCNMKITGRVTKYETFVLRLIIRLWVRAADHCR